ncbi:MAG: peptide ABC transporter substrate-binding protein [Patescibacteria group bacterium]
MTYFIPPRLKVGEFLQRLLARLYGTRDWKIETVLKQAGQNLSVSPRQFRLLPRILTRLEKRTALFLVIIVLLTGGLWLSRWYNNHTFVLPEIGGTLNEGLIGFPRTTNPLLAQNQSEQDLARLLYRSLFHHTATGQIDTDLVDKWEVGRDSKKYQFTLKSNLFWQDGTPITSRDVIFTFKSILDKNLNSSLNSGFRNVKAVAVNDKTFTITLPDSYAGLLHSLTFGILPEHIWQGIPASDWLKQTTNLTPIGSSAWQIKEWKRNQQNQIVAVSLAPFANQSGTPYLTDFNLRFFENNTEALGALKQGLINALAGLNLNQTQTISRSQYNLHQLQLPQYTALFFNTDQAPLNDKNIRQALNLLINKNDLIATALNNQVTLANGPLTNSAIKINNSTTKLPDLAYIEKLLTTSGFTKKEDTWQNKNGSLTLTITALDQAHFRATAEYLKTAWEKFGIKTELKFVSADDLSGNIIPNRAYTALLATEIIGLDNDLLAFWHSSQSLRGANLSNFKYRDLDIILENLRFEQNAEKIKDSQQKLVNILLNESPAIFLYQQYYNYVMTKDIKGVNSTIINQPSDRLNTSANWYTKTKHVFKLNK